MTKVGQDAPSFVLPSATGEPLALSSLKGRKVLLVFFPNAFTRICGGEICSLRDDIVGELDANTTLLAISTDPWQVLRKWTEDERFPFRMLSDFWPHGAVSQAFGAFDEERGTAVRATFILDEEHVVRWSIVNGHKDPRNPDDYLAALAALGSGHVAASGRPPAGG